MSRGARLLFYTDASAWGGAEVVLRELVGCLDERFAVVVAGADRDVVERLAAARPGAQARVVPRMASKRDLSAMLAWRRLIVETRPDITQLNLQIPSAARYATAVACTTRRTRVVVVEHLPMPIHSRLGRWLKRATARRIAAHIAVGERAAREVETIAGLPRGSIRTLRNGVPRPEPASRERSSPVPVVATVGRLDRQKGIDVLLHAMVEVPHARLVVAGSGPSGEELAALATTLGIADRVTWTGWVDAPARVLADCDVFALPSRFEGFPLVVLEAMLVGVPVVATDVGSVAEAVVDGRTGRLVPPEDPVALAAAIRCMLDDPATARRLAGEAERVASAKFTVEAMTRRYEQLYDEVLGR
jgi:glycosyltransferase involved in cell wall biosynthesis